MKLWWTASSSMRVVTITARRAMDRKPSAVIPLEIVSAEESCLDQASLVSHTQ